MKTLYHREPIFASIYFAFFEFVGKNKTRQETSPRRVWSRTSLWGWQKISSITTRQGGLPVAKYSIYLREKNQKKMPSNGRHLRDDTYETKSLKISMLYLN